MSKTLLIIGAGISGLHCGNSLIKDFDNVIILEKGNEVGGLAKSVKYKGDFLEKFYHYYGPETPHIFSLLSKLKLSHLIKWTNVKRGSFFDDGFYPMEKPTDLLKFSKISFISRLRLGVFVVFIRYFIKWETIDKVLAKDWLIKWLGRQTYEILWKPLIKLKFKEFKETIPAPFIWSRVKIQTEKIAYIEGGLNECINKLEKEFISNGGTLLTNKEISKISVRNNQANGIFLSNGKFIKADKIITTIPTPVLEKLCTFKSQELELIKEKKWMGVVCAVLLVKKPITNYMWLNLISKKIPFVGLIDYTHLNPNYTVDGCRVIYVPDYVSTDHLNYKMSNEKFLNLVYENLVKINPKFTRQWVKKGFVFRAPYAQNIPFSNFKKRIIPVVSNINNLFICDWSQFYPWDRGLSNSIKIANQTIKKVKESLL